MKQQKAKGYSKTSQKYVEGIIHHRYANGIGVITKNGIVFSKSYHKEYCRECDIDISFEEYLRNTLTENNGTMKKFNVKAIWKIDTGENFCKRAYIVFTDRTKTSGSFDDAIRYARKAGYTKANGGQEQDFDCLNKPCNEAVLFDFEIEEWEE